LINANADNDGEDQAEALRGMVNDWWWGITQEDRNQWYRDVQTEGAVVTNEFSGDQHYGVYSYTIVQGDDKWLNDLPANLRQLVVAGNCTITLEVSILSPHSNEEEPLRSIAVVITKPDGTEYDFDPNEDPPLIA
jgi:hypothetical protein